MSKPAQSFVTYLRTKAGVTAELGTRIYANYLPKSASFPCAVYNEISKVPEHHLGGADAVTKARVQIDIFATVRSQADDAAEAIRLAADGYRGTAGTDYIQTCHLDTQQDDHDDPVDGSDRRRFRIRQDWIIAVTETLPSL